MYRVEIIEEDFSSQEAADMSGVSQDLQREWRRRGILPQQEGRKRIRYSLRDVARLKVLGILSASGISVKLQKTVAWQIASLMEERAVQIREAAAVEGLALTDDEFGEMIVQLHGGRLGPYYTLFRLPEPPEGSELVHANMGGTSLADVEAMALKDGPVGAALIMEAQTLARELAASAPRPLVTYRITGGAD